MFLFKKRTLLSCVLLLIIGCEEDNVDVEGCTDPNALNYDISATISDQEICEYNNGTNTELMPNIITSSNILVSQYNSVLFDDIITIPENIEWLSDTTLLSHGVDPEFEALDYWYLCNFSSHNHDDLHQIHVSDANYLIKEKSTEDIFKLHFEDYNIGEVVFKYAKLGEQVETIITPKFYEGPYYFNFATNSVDTINWHISLQKIIVEY